MRSRLPSIVLMAAAASAVASPAWAQTSSTLFGNLLTQLLAAVSSAIVTPIGNVLSAVALPAATLAAVYIAVFGMAVSTGRVASPAGEAVVRCFKVGAIGLLVAGSGNYTSWVSNNFLIAAGSIPVSLANAIAGTQGVTVVDSLWAQVVNVIGLLAQQFSITAPVQAVGIAMALIMTLVFGVVCCGIAFIEVALAQIGMAMVVMVGPVFIVALMFEQTSRWFWGWVSELVHYTVTYLLLAAAGTLATALTAYWSGQLTGKSTAGLLNLVVFVGYVAIGLVLTVFIFLRAAKIAHAIAGGSSSTALASLGRAAMMAVGR
jgi:type IV secretion system protein VirB6